MFALLQMESALPQTPGIFAPVNQDSGAITVKPTMMTALELLVRTGVLVEMESATTVVIVRQDFLANTVKNRLTFVEDFPVPMVVPASNPMVETSNVRVLRDLKAKIVPSISMNVSQIHV